MASGQANRWKEDKKIRFQSTHHQETKIIDTPQGVEELLIQENGGESTD